jgi:2'-5' RNA ligase
VTSATGGASARREPARRLFFALWPDEAARSRLAALVSSLLPGPAGRIQRPDQWHVTLEFLGDVPESRLPAVLEAGAAATGAATSCELEFDRLEHWKRPQVLCLVAQSVPEPLARLAQSLRAELLSRGFVLDTRAFRPHLTLARRVAQAPPPAAFEPLRWPAEVVSLVQSATDSEGSRYVDLAAWPTGH